MEPEDDDVIEVQTNPAAFVTVEKSDKRDGIETR